MQYTNLGRTGLRVSRMGVGCGGPSRIGRQAGCTERQSAHLIRLAVDAGVNLIDTAESYGTEDIVGLALKDLPRDQIVLATKKGAGTSTSAADMQAGLDAALQRLGTDYVDIYNLHAVVAADYAHVQNEIVPALLKFKQQGKVRFIGVTERFIPDPQHDMLQLALNDDVWDVMMVGFNLLNQSARDRVFLETERRGIGTLIMFAVRRALSRPERLQEVLAELVANGQLDPAEIDRDNPFGFLIHDGGAKNLTDAAYRFCRDEPGVHVVLSGTGSEEHLRENLASFERPPLPPADMKRLKHIFRAVDSVSAH